MHVAAPKDGSETSIRQGECHDRELEAIPIEEDVIRLKLEADFTRMRDIATFYYRSAGFKRHNPWIRVGREHKLFFKLDHFTGCRFGLVVYSTEKAGGSARFSDFVYRDR